MYGVHPNIVNDIVVDAFLSEPTCSHIVNDVGNASNDIEGDLNDSPAHR